MAYATCQQMSLLIAVMGHKSGKIEPDKYNPYFVPAPPLRVGIEAMKVFVKKKKPKK